MNSNNYHLNDVIHDSFSVASHDLCAGVEHHWRPTRQRNTRYGLGERGARRTKTHYSFFLLSITWHAWLRAFGSRQNFGLCPVRDIFSPVYIGSILGGPAADSGGEGKSKPAEKYGTKKSKERREEPLGTMSYQTSSKRSPPFWLLIGARKLLCFSAQSEGRTAATV